MKSLSPLLVAAVTCVGCASQPEVEVVESAITHSYQVVPRKADVAAYPAVSEHVLNVASPYRNFVVIKVTNYAKPKPLPVPIFTPVAPPTAPKKPVVTTPIEPVQPKTQQMPVVQSKDAEWEETIHFDFDAALLSKDAKRQLDKFAEYVGSALAEGDIRVEAYADSMGSEGYNRKLTTQRATEVAKYLMQKGAKASQIKATGMGSTHPVATNATEQGRAANRRAELHVQTKE